MAIEFQHIFPILTMILGGAVGLIFKRLFGRIDEDKKEMDKNYRELSARIESLHVEALTQTEITSIKSELKHDLEKLNEKIDRISETIYKLQGYLEK